ncbi:MAG TPA: TRAP transporter small permease [Burkholderiaceae bacterium]|nr:TRAP transporter small permease [Burkholderiaceae bacterium]
MSATVAPQAGAARLARRIQNVLDALIGAILTIITISLIYQIFGRYVVGRAPSWTEEVARMLIVWLTMLGAAACLRGGSHIAVTVLVNALPAGPRKLVLWLRDFAILMAVAVLSWAGLRYAMLNATQDSAALEVPMFWAYLSLCVGPALIALQLCLSRIGGEEPTVDPLEW